MNVDSTDQERREDRCPDLKLLTAKEALGGEPRPIEVPENAELELSPTNPEYASSFARVRLKSYEDLRTLGLVPRKLHEEKVRQALAADDGEVYDLAGKMLQRSAGGCGCSKDGSDASRLRGSPIRGVYQSIRSRHNPALARVLADHYGTQIPWDSPVPAIVRKWVVAAQASPELIIGYFGDITIYKNATLSVAPGAKSLLAWNIWIHSTGRLVGHGSYLRIWANSISRFSGFLSVAVVDAARKIAPVWALAESK